MGVTPANLNNFYPVSVRGTFAQGPFPQTTQAQQISASRNMQSRGVSSLGGTLTSPLGTGMGVLGGTFMNNGLGTLMSTQNTNAKMVTQKRGASITTT